MLSFLRAPHPPRTRNAHNDLILYENGSSSVQWHSKGSTYIMTHTFPPNPPNSEPSIVQPPFHYHIYQTERFHCAKGTANMYFGLNPKPSLILTPEKAPAVLGPNRYHRFENASATEELVMDIQLDPEDSENEQRFFRNFFGYLDDCKRMGMSPSVFQLFVFLYSADTPLAIPMPFGLETLGVWVSWVLMVVVAGIGTWVLGYRSSYPEYYEEGKSR